MEGRRPPCRQEAGLPAALPGRLRRQLGRLGQDLLEADLEVPCRLLRLPADPRVEVAGREAPVARVASAQGPLLPCPSLPDPFGPCPCLGPFAAAASSFGSADTASEAFADRPSVATSDPFGLSAV